MKNLETRIPPPMVTLVFALIIYLIDKVASLTSQGERVRRIVAAVFIAASLLAIIGGVLAFHKRRTTVNPLRPDRATSLVVEGVYRMSRNPMYLGMLLILCAWSIWLGNPWGVLGLVGFVVYMNRFQIIPEERTMREKFGMQWDTYAARVRRWI